MNSKYVDLTAIMQVIGCVFNNPSILSHDDKYKIYAFFGKSGAGKDTIQKWIVSHRDYETKGIVSCTTRPKRDNEVDGEDYYFLTNEEFTKEVLNGNMLEATEFNDWFYGTRISELDKDKINVGVFNIQGIECLLDDPRLDVTPFYVNVPDKTRLMRVLQREENPDCHEICRRFLSDEKDFDDINFEYETIYNHSDFGYAVIQIDRFL